jgi:hypothetical protein
MNDVGLLVGVERKERPEYGRTFLLIRTGETSRAVLDAREPLGRTLRVQPSPKF